MSDPVPEVDLLAEDHIRCPYQLYRELQRGPGVAVDPGLGIAIAGYDSLVALSKDTDTFSSSISADGKGPRHMGIGEDPVQPDVEEILSAAHPIVNALFTADPPVHTRHRKLISKALSPRRVRELEPHIRQLCHQLIDAFAEADTVDFLPQFAVALPVTVIADILGVDRADIWTFKRWGDLMISGNVDLLDHARRREVARAVVELHAYFVPRIEQRRRQPTQDLLSEMVNATVDDEEPLSTAELLPIIDQILLAGHETTTNLLANGMLVLLRDPGEMRRLREDPQRIEPFIEEVLRFDPPIQCTYRRATVDTELLGVPVSRGQMVIPMWGAAGYDPRVFPNPDVFDPLRPNVRQHMGFGHGPHFCAGAELARLEARIAFEVLLERLGDIRLDEAASDLRPLPSFAARGVRRLVLGITATRARGET